MSTQPIPWREVVLEILGTSNGGFTTGDLAQQAAWQIPYLRGMTRPQRSGAMRARLLDMESAGIIKRMDDELPIVWMSAAAPSGGSVADDKTAAGRSDT